MTIASGCRGFSPPTQHHPLGQLDARQSQNRRLEISLTITIDDASSFPGKTHGANDKGALFDAQGNPLNFDDQHLYGGMHQRANGQQEQSGYHADWLDGSQRLQQQALESLQLIDRTMSDMTIQACIVQSEKMVVDTRNAIANGYVDSASKANNAATQGGKGINF
ncbi:hypothetical protein ACUY1T_21480 [Billgrantia sp. Q4P2]|uniref:hypothetical protein n=1 Tax=Billgrantia sp. Q4P2 TaxID=3463857 RepID=UPI004057A526